MPIELLVGKKLPRHDTFDRQAKTRDFWRRSDVVQWDYAHGVDAGGSSILPKHEREKPDRYDRRKSQAIGRKYAGPIIDRFNDHVCRVTATRPEVASGTPYGQLLVDADGAGTPLATFMRRRLRAAQVEGCSYVLADSNVEGLFKTAADEQAAGVRGILRAVRADQVLWWRDWQGQPVEALILFEGPDGLPFGWYVTIDTAQRIHLKLEEKSLLVVSVDEPASHKYGGCPLVRLSPVFAEDQAVGEDSQISPLAESQKRVCNMESWLYEELQYGTFTTPVFLGCSKDEVSEVSVGPGMALCLPGSNGSTPSIDTLGADPAQADSLRSTLVGEVREIYRVAGLSPGNPTETGQPESGVAKAFAFNEVEAKLSALADAAQLTENTSIKRLAKGFAFTYPGDCDWPDNFAMPDLASELEVTIRTTTSNLPAVLKRKQVEGYAGKAFQLTGPEKATLKIQLDEGEQQASEDAAILRKQPPNPDRNVGT